MAREGHFGGYMEVKKYCLMLSFIFLVACNDSAEDKIIDSPNNPANQPDLLCKKVEGQYLIRYYSGEIKKVYVDSREDLIENYIEPELNEIEYVHSEVRIGIPKIENGIQAQAYAGVQWPHERMHTDAAWSKGIDGSGIRVAVIDSGVNVQHPQLKDAILINDGEIPNNGIDDDGNDYVDDYLGYDFAAESGDINDLNGHGTHVAGTIAAQHQHESLPKGVAPGAKILALNFMDANGMGDTYHAIQAIKYAAKRGVQIINASWGSSGCTDATVALRDTIAEVTAKGILFVAASGNNNLDLDIYDSYPTSFGLQGVLSVSALTPSGLTASFSNYGPNSVDIIAPGQSIYSTYAGEEEYRYLSGTSMATPMVAGAAALVLQMQNGLSPLAAKNAILESIEPGYFPVISRGELSVQNLVERFLPSE
tara:strand:+ start:2508 stop:3776 length:1269 start_codon:yes stop_codon:yes gene_type:complete